VLGPGGFTGHPSRVVYLRRRIVYGRASEAGPQKTQ
jgi:hypothetical protein